MEALEEELRPEDRGYREAIGKVEPYGIDHIPDVERHGHVSSQFTIWAGGNLVLATLITGFYPVFYGLSVTGALTAVLAGTLAGSILMGVLATMGTRLGVPQQVLARGPLGYFGNFLPVAVVNIFASVGWTAVYTVFGAWALQAVIDMPFWLASLILIVGQGILGFFGYNMVHWANRFSTVVLGAFFIVITILALEKASFSFGVNPEADYWIGERGGWITSAGLFLAWLLTWMPFASDYSRYLPRETPERKVALYTGLGNFLVVSWLGCLGVVLSNYAGALEPVQVVEQLTGGFSTVALIVIVLSTIPAASLDIYGGALSLLTLGVRIPRHVAALLVTAAAFGITLYIHTDIYGKFYNFLVLTAYLIAPYVTVIVLDYFLAGRNRVERIPELYDRRRVLEWGFVSWLVGCVASVPFWVWSSYTGPFAKDNPNWGDLSYYVGALATIVCFFLLRGRRPLSEILRGRTADDGLEAGVARTAAREPAR